MPLTNADYLSNPQPPSSDLVAHYQSLGASPERAKRLAKVVRTRRIAKGLTKPMMLIALGCAVWVAYALVLAADGSPSTPSRIQMLWPAFGAMIAGLIVTIARAVSLTSGMFWEPSKSIPRELATMPRRAIVPRVGIGGIFLGVGFACAVMIGGIIVPEVRNASLLQRNGVETTGTVIGRSVRSGKSKSYIVRYRYRSPEVLFQSSAKVRRSDYERMTEGTTVPVTYDPTNPTISKPISRAELGGVLEALMPLLGITGGIAVLAMLMTMLMSFAQRQSEALVTRGVAVLGRVTQVGGNGARYEYDTPQGVIDARADFGKQRPAPLPVVGETYVFLYDPDNTRRSLPLAAAQDVRFV